MTQARTTGWTLGGHSVERVWAVRRGLSVPTAVEIDDDEQITDSSHPNPRATTVQLTVSLGGLTDDVVQELLERLVGMHGVRPPEFPLSAEHNEVSVPLLEPTVPDGDDRVQWTITDRLSLVHADRCDSYFAVAGENVHAWDRPVVELTAAQTWLLIRALATIRCWQFELETAFAAAATQRRTAPRSVDSTTAATATQTPTTPSS